ncbi:MAG TPA: TspO/MBR family protein [Candidatus Saccharimonadales bacterium]|nr:TspO/MBR family protein [Candidatus Saccharimonadales bacterium]
MNKILTFIISVAIPFVAGAIGSIATIPNIPTWYAALEKPFFNPPNWVFGPVWTLLYILMGVSLYLVWTARNKQPKKRAYTLFGAQLVLNTLWSLVFFGLQWPWLAVVVILALWITIVMTMQAFRRYSQTSFWLFIPYIAWVSFAAVLNISVALLN